MQADPVTGPPTPAEPVPTLIALLRRAGRAMADELLARIDAAGHEGITMPAHLVFESLPPAGARLTTLAQRTGTTHQATGEVVADLVRRGYLTRVPDPADGRARLVVLTDRGRDLVRVALAEIAAIERSWLDRLAAGGLTGDLHAALRAACDPPVTPAPAPPSSTRPGTGPATAPRPRS